MGGSYFSHLDENYTNNQNNLNDKRKSTENYKVKKFKMNNKIDPEIILNSELQTNKEINNKNLLNSSDLINENETNIQKGTILKVKPLNTDFNDEIETVSDDERSSEKDFESNVYLDFNQIQPKNQVIGKEQNSKRGFEAENQNIFLVQENFTLYLSFQLNYFK